VLVAVEAYSVNRGETLLLEQPVEGWRPGKDVAGTVVEAAADGSGPPAGTRVVGHPPNGGWCTRVAVAVADVAVLPPQVSSVTAAALPLAGLTALRLVRRAGWLAGRRLLVTGASGGVGHYVVELAAAAGAEVTAISASSARGERLRALGAAEVRSTLPSGGPPFDVVMESVGGESLRSALMLLREEGRLLWFGQASRQPAALDFFDFWDGPVQASITHIDYTRGERTFGEDLATLVGLVGADRLHPELGIVRPWTDTPEVIALLRARQVRGNAVLTLPPRHRPERRPRRHHHAH
jgi:NADPH:quinone reductase-like Zn-dependent oxidoreductase